jgi:G3E family GTPase
MSQLVRLDGVVTVVDAKHVSRHLDEGDRSDAPNEALEQLAYADRIILNKTDLVAPEELEVLERRIRAINAMASITRAQRGDVPVDYILGVGGYDLERVQETVETAASGGHSHSHEHDHSDCDHEHGRCEHEDGHSHEHDHSDCDHEHGKCNHEGHDHGHDHSHGLHNDSVSSVSLRTQGNLDLIEVCPLLCVW